MVETPRANLVPGMKWLVGTYTMRFNHWHRPFGRLFSGRYKALPVDGSGYLKSVCDYVHLNPAGAKIAGREEKLSAFRWSPLPAIPHGARLASGIAEGGRSWNTQASNSGSEPAPQPNLAASARATSTKPRLPTESHSEGSDTSPRVKARYCNCLRP